MKFDHNNIDVPTYVLQRRSTVSACSPLRIIDEGGSDTITPSKRFQLQRQSLKAGVIHLKDNGNVTERISPKVVRRNAFKETKSESFESNMEIKRPAIRSRSEGYGGSIQMHTAAAISHATKASIQKSGSRRISWGISRKTGINFSVEDLRHRSTKIVVLGKENVGKTAFVVRFVTRRFISEYMNDKHTCYEHDAAYSDGETHRFEILDLSNPVLQSAEDEKGEKDFEDNIRWGDAFMLLYSTVDRPSFNEITRLAFLISFLHKCSSPKPIVTLVATKIDLEDTRMISEVEGRKLAESIGARFHEVSASESYVEIERIFRESADLSRFSLVKTPLLNRRASGTGTLSSSSSILPTFRSSGTISSCLENDESDFF